VRCAWEERVAARLRAVLRASVAEHFPGASCLAEDRVPRLAARLARAEVEAVERGAFEPAGGGGEEALGAQDLEAAIHDIVREAEGLAALGLAPEGAAAAGGAPSAPRLFVSAIELVDFATDQLLLAAAAAPVPPPMPALAVLAAL